MIEMPLQYFGCGQGASINPELSEIAFEGSGRGIVVYGPYTVLQPGYYNFLLNLDVPMTTMIPRLKIEIFAGSTVYAEYDVTTHASKIYASAYFDHKVAVEIRIHSDWTKFSLKSVLYEQSERAIPSQRAVRTSMLASLTSLLRSDLDDISSGWNTPEIAAEAIFGDNSVFVFPVEHLQRHNVMLRKLGIRVDAVRALFKQADSKLRHPRGDKDFINSHLDVSPALADGYPKVSNSFQENAILDIGFELVSPFSGAKVKSVDSIPVPFLNTISPIMYEFLEASPFVVGASCGWVGSVTFIWFIELDIVVVSNPGEAMWVNPEQAIAHYVSFCAKHVELLKSYRGKDRTLALAAGFIGNMGHYFWNEVAGFERMIRATNLENVAKVYTRKTNWLEIEHIFEQTIAENAKLRVKELQSINQLPFEVLQNSEFLIRPTATSIDSELTSKIEIRSADIFRETERSRFDAANNLISRAGIVLFSNLRAHNKCWIEQRDGIVDIAKMLNEYVRQPNPSTPANDIYSNSNKGPVVVFLDGFHDCTDEAKAIMELGPSNVIFVDGTKVSFAETLYWAFNCHAFTAIVGSGLVPVTWLADKSGVCFSERQHLRQMTWWRSVRKMQGTILHPEFEEITDDEDKLYANFSINPKVISGLLKLALLKSEASRLNK